MAINILLGVGGTGSKVVEAMVHCFAAGLGPGSVHIGFVDQDKSNGNVERALETVEAACEARSHWRQPGGDHQIDSGPLLECEISLLEPKLWTPYPKPETRLFQALEILDEDRSAFDLLYLPGEAEQDLKLRIGFQAKAHVGAAAIAAAVDPADPFWQSIKALIEQAEAGTPVNILLAGSVFGGTGAAGFPTIARLLRGLCQGTRGRVRFGGVLMLPYFEFGEPAEPTAARFREILPQTRGALRYYANLLQREPVFDELYLLGWDKYFRLGYGQAGSGAQKNPALVPELLAAMAGSRFLGDDGQPRQDEGNAMFVCARERSERIGWTDMPPGARDRANQAFEKLTQQLRFAIAWKHWHPFLVKANGRWREKYRRYGWYRRHGLSDLDAEGTAVRKPVESMSRFVDLLLKWAATIESYRVRTDPELDFDLWSLDTLLAEPARFDNPTSPVVLFESLDENAFGESFAHAIHGRTAGDRLAGADWVLGRLHRRNPTGKGLGRFVGALHALSAPQHVDPRKA